MANLLSFQDFPSAVARKLARSPVSTADSPEKTAEKRLKTLGRGDFEHLNTGIQALRGHITDISRRIGQIEAKLDSIDAEVKKIAAR